MMERHFSHMAIAVVDLRRQCQLKDKTCIVFGWQKNGVKRSPQETNHF